jgi:hypothetical protein
MTSRANHGLFLFFFRKTGLPPAKGKGKGNDLISKGRSEGVNETVCA